MTFLAIVASIILDILVFHFIIDFADAYFSPELLENIPATAQ